MDSASDLKEGVFVGLGEREVGRSGVYRIHSIQA